MACQQRNQCSYSDGSIVRYTYIVTPRGPRSCATKTYIQILCTYLSPGVWEADLTAGGTLTVTTQGVPGEWSAVFVGFPTPGPGPNPCTDLPADVDDTVLRDDCFGYHLRTELIYNDGSSVEIVTRIDLLNNAGCM